jgi:hypothetical protein
LEEFCHSAPNVIAHIADIAYNDDNWGNIESMAMCHISQWGLVTLRESATLLERHSMCVTGEGDEQR